MANTIVDLVRRQMGFEPLQMVDPNTQEAPVTEVFTSPVSALAQAAIPTVLAAMYKKAKTEQGAEELLAITDTYHYLPFLYGEKENLVVDKVAGYSKTGAEKATETMAAAAEATIKVLHEQIANVTPEEAAEFFTAHRSEILNYLPASLHIGHLLDDNAIDDHTNKMRGPVSGFMHTIENIFATTK